MATERLFRGIDPAGMLHLDDHLHVHGHLPQLPSRKRDAFTLIGQVERSGLTGRGGGAFPVARKLHAVVTAGRSPIVVANGSESEPASAKDVSLLLHAPHLVLDGAIVAAAAVGSSEIVICVHHGADDALDALQTAVRERRDRARIRVMSVPDRYVAGESSAMVQYLNGGEAKPTFGVRMSQRGVDKRPTLVQNVETLAHLALIARHGSGWFRGAGTPEEPGTTLVTLTGAVAAPGVYEIGIGTPLAEVLARAGGLSRGVQGFLVGGYSGGWLPPSASGVRLSNAALTLQGSTLGCAAVVALGDDVCPLDEVAAVTAYMAGETAGQCGPCVFGLAAIGDAVQRIAAGRADVHDADRVHRWAEMVKGRGACSHPDGTARFVETAMRVFDGHVRSHVRGGHCRAHGAAVLPVPVTSGGWR